MPKKRVPSVDTLVRQLGQHARKLSRELGEPVRISIASNGSKVGISIAVLTPQKTMVSRQTKAAGSFGVAMKLFETMNVTLMQKSLEKKG